MKTKVKNIDGTEVKNVLSDDKKKQDEKNRKLSKGIALSVEIESNFKLLSYRIIEQEIFLSKIDELVEFYLAK
jgi:hypothetical protein